MSFPSIAPLRVFIVGGTGFIGRHLSRALAEDARIVLVQPISRHARSQQKPPASSIQPVKAANVTSDSFPEVLGDIMRANAVADVSSAPPRNVVVNLVGILHPTRMQGFNETQNLGARRVAESVLNLNTASPALPGQGTRLVHVSAIGADASSPIAYARTKGLAEREVFRLVPDATVIRPSLVVGPDDSFFNRFAFLSRFLPFLPVFSGGHTRFQPIHVEDLVRYIHAIIIDESGNHAGKIIECGGPKVYTFRELMQAILALTQRTRMIVSIPAFLGILLGRIVDLFIPLGIIPDAMVLTADQVQLLGQDNVVEESRDGDERVVGLVGEKDVVEDAKAWLGSKQKQT